MATIRQDRSPADLPARIVGLSTASIPVTGPVGVLATGVLIDAIGLRQTLLLSTALAAVIAVATWASSGPRLFDPATAPRSRTGTTCCPRRLLSGAGTRIRGCACLTTSGLPGMAMMGIDLETAFTRTMRPLSEHLQQA